MTTSGVDNGVKHEDHIGYLFTAELQFRLASAVRLATDLKRQPLDLPPEWSHGPHHVKYSEIALCQNQAEFSAGALQHSATLMMAVAIKDAIEAVVPTLPKAVKKAKKGIDPVVRKVIAETSDKAWRSSDNDVASAYHIARLIRNAFAHAPFEPVWMIRRDLQGKTMGIANVIELKTEGLNKTRFNLSHCEGPLALLKLCRFVRSSILNYSMGPRKDLPTPNRVINQIDNVIIEKVDAIPSNAVRVEIQRRADGGIDLGDGYVLHIRDKSS